MILVKDCIHPRLFKRRAPKRSNRLGLVITGIYMWIIILLKCSLTTFVIVHNYNFPITMLSLNYIPDKVLDHCFDSKIFHAWIVSALYIVFQLAPTGSDSLLKALRDVGNPHQSLNKLYDMMGRLLERIKELKTGPKADCKCQYMQWNSTSTWLPLV